MHSYTIAALRASLARPGLEQAAVRVPLGHAAADLCLKGGLERWLYRLVRRHGGRQPGGWSFDLRHLHLKSGSLSPFKRFAFEVRAIVQRQPLPGYRLSLGIGSDGLPRLCFHPTPANPFAAAASRPARRRSGSL